MYSLFKSSRPIGLTAKNILTFSQKLSLFPKLLKVYREFVCACPKSDKLSNKINMIQASNETQVERQVNTILYVPGGRTQFGNFTNNDVYKAYLEEVKYNPNALANDRVNFNGKFEGQPGGTRGPLRNKF
jgi:hypothetical protein